MYAKIENNTIVHIAPSAMDDGTWIEINEFNMNENYCYNVDTNTIEIDNNPPEPPAPTDEEFALINLQILRDERNARLAATDWMANSDVTMSDAWRDYRQALRDITNTYSNRDEVVWPTKPE